MKRFTQFVGPLLILCVFMAAVWMLHHELRKHSLSAIRDTLHNIPARQIAASLVLTTINYIVLIGYDVLAARATGLRLPLRRVALASFTGFVCSYNFGALLGGTSVRYRFYSTWGVSAVNILQLVVMLVITFWVGVLALGGVVFVLDPFPIPKGLPIPFETVRPLGWILIALAVGYVLITALHRRPIRWRDTETQLPGPGMTTIQILVAAADLMVAAGCLYVLLPQELGLSFFQFLGVYLLAVVAVVFTHVPGGVGVLEVVIVTMASEPAKEGVAAGLVAFRIIYYLLPLAVTAVLLAGYEVRLQRAKARRVLLEAGKWVSVVVPDLISFATFVAGGVLLLSGAIPGTRRLQVESLLPLPLTEVSHFLGSVIGVGLLLLARGLQRRLDSAFWLTALLLAGGIAATLLRGFDFEEAGLLTFVLVVLLGCRREFYRKGSLIHQRFTPGWVVAVVLTVTCSIGLGIFEHKHTEFSTELWWQFAFRSDAPRFLRASVGVAAVLLGFAIRKLLRPHAAHETEPIDWPAVERIVAQSPNTTANFAFLGDKRFLFNADHTAFLMYAVQRRSWVAMGDPVGPASEVNELVWQFREACDEYDGWPVFYQVSPANLSVYVDQGLTLLKLGEEAHVPLADFSLEGSSRKPLRQTCNRMEREGCEFALVPPEQFPSVLPELKKVSDAWLAAKNVQEKGFSLGFFSEDYLRRFPIAVARQADRIVAFANVWLGGDKQELSVDLMRYVPDAPSGVMEFVFVRLMEWGREQGYEWFNLGMAPLSGIDDRPLAPLWNKASGLVFRHGDHFYSFQGLREYKEKFDPIWKPKYLASPGGWALPQIIADVTTLIQRRRKT